MKINNKRRGFVVFEIDRLVKSDDHVIDLFRLHRNNEIS